jgi:hypothetical protein
MADKTEEQLIEQEMKRRERFAVYGKGTNTGKVNEKKAAPEEDAGAPKTGWFKKQLDVITGESTKKAMKESAERLKKR